MAELPTSMNTRSPGPNALSKLNMAMIDNTSNAPVESTYGVNQNSVRGDGVDSVLDGLLNGMSPDVNKS